jgi:hypothetical protein
MVQEQLILKESNKKQFSAVVSKKVKSNGIPVTGHGGP